MKTRNLSDWAVALIVIICSAILFAALAIALSGRMLGKPARSILVNFHDVSGINVSSQVKYAGAPAGTVSGIRMLTPEERAASGDPLNAVQITLALTDKVPPLPADIKVSLAASTLLSDKFILLNDGSPTAPLLVDNAVLQGITPTSFDKLARDVDSAIETLRTTLGGAEGNTDEIFARIRTMIADTQSLLAEAKPALQDARAVAADAKSLISENKEQIARTIARLDKASLALEQLATRGNNLIQKNETNLTSSIGDLKVTAQNFKVTSTYTKFLTRSLAIRPSQLIWGSSKPPILPSELEILRSSKPIPDN